jgi:hypothetical protein
MSNDSLFNVELLLIRIYLQGVNNRGLFINS